MTMCSEKGCVYPSAAPAPPIQSFLRCTNTIGVDHTVLEGTTHLCIPHPRHIDTLRAHAHPSRSSPPRRREAAY